MWKRYFEGWVLYFTSVLLGLVIIPFGVGYGIVKGFVKRSPKTGFALTNKKLLILATSIDKYGNVACKELFNDTLIVKDSVKRFGKIRQTISAVIGHNLLDGTLTKTGYALNDTLDFIDPNHSIKAIQKEEQ